MDICDAAASDAGLIASIYNHFVRSSIVTFEEEEVADAEMESRIEGVRSAGLPWYVATDAQMLLGYAYATPWRTRSAYRYSVEATVYVAPEHAGRGVGTALYRALMPALQQRGIHAALAGIALPNEGSVALHERFGFSQAAHLREVGFKMGRWVDVGYWQLVFG